MILNKVIQMAHKYQPKQIKFNGEEVPICLDKYSANFEDFINGVLGLGNPNGQFSKLKVEYYIDHNNYYIYLTSGSFELICGKDLIFSQNIIGGTIIEFDRNYDKVTKIILLAKEKTHDRNTLEIDIKYDENNRIIEFKSEADMYPHVLEYDDNLHTVKIYLNDNIVSEIYLSDDNFINSINTKYGRLVYEYNDNVLREILLSTIDKYNDDGTIIYNEWESIIRYNEYGDLIYYTACDAYHNKMKLEFEISYNNDLKINKIIIQDDKYEFIY